MKKDRNCGMNYPVYPNFPVMPVPMQPQMIPQMPNQMPGQMPQMPMNPQMGKIGRASCRDRVSAVV